MTGHMTGRGSHEVPRTCRLNRRHQKAAAKANAAAQPPGQRFFLRTLNLPDCGPARSTKLWAMPWVELGRAENIMQLQLLSE